MTQQQIEEIELKYLTKYYHFLKYVEDRIIFGFKTRESIKDDWVNQYKGGISNFATGTERILYHLISKDDLGQPNSCPVSSDFMFEFDDAIIHIDIKSVGASLVGKTNIGDFTKNIFIGKNQNSYKGCAKVYEGKKREFLREYKPSLPTYYNKNKLNEKICLSYFLGILFDRDNIEPLVIYLVCMPNGDLESHYESKTLTAGKNLDKTRFNFKKVNKFELLENQLNRMKIIHFNHKMHETYRKKLKYFESLI